MELDDETLIELGYSSVLDLKDLNRETGYMHVWKSRAADPCRPLRISERVPGVGKRYSQCTKEERIVWNERQRELRALLTKDELADRRKKDARRAREWWARLTKEQRARICKRQRESKLKRCAKGTSGL